VYLCYALDHQYTVASLNLANLKGDDYNRARYVADGCREAGGFCVLLANLSMVVTFPNDEGDDDRKSHLQLNRIVDMEGFVLKESLLISTDYLLQNLYHSRDPDSQTGGEYMGNQHADIDQIYNDTVRN
jgi:hypothetical protein